MKQSLLALKILIGFYVTLAIILMIFPLLGMGNISGLIFMSILTFGWAYFHFKVRSGLLQEKYWAWVASIIIFGTTILSLLFPIGILGMIGALKKETRDTIDTW